ncbi:MAG: non-canonical purine NTP pyrophosphatase, partial [Planctomycetota bacterium]
MFDLVLGTGNKKKLVELRMLLPEDRTQLTAIGEIPEAIEVVEDADTFAGNAAKKATEQARHLGRWVLAEDSGLCVDALGGAPGVFSARFAGQHGDDEANNQKLLEELEGVPEERRGAHYVCHLCLSDPAGNVKLQQSGECHGRIGTERVGTGGYGYDPLIVVREYHRTVGSMDLVVKRAI